MIILYVLASEGAEEIVEGFVWWGALGRPSTARNGLTRADARPCLSSRDYGGLHGRGVGAGHSEADGELGEGPYVAGGEEGEEQGAVCSCRQHAHRPLRSSSSVLQVQYVKSEIWVSKFS